MHDGRALLLGHVKGKVEVVALESELQTKTKVSLTLETEGPFLQSNSSDHNRSCLMAVGFKQCIKQKGSQCWGTLWHSGLVWTRLLL